MSKSILIVILIALLLVLITVSGCDFWFWCRLVLESVNYSSILLIHWSMDEVYVDSIHIGYLKPFDRISTFVALDFDHEVWIRSSYGAEYGGNLEHLYSLQIIPLTLCYNKTLVFPRRRELR